MKSRSSTGVGQKIDLEYNIETMRITDLGEEAQDSHAKKPAASIMESIKARSVVEDSHSKDTPKVTAEIQSNKLKQLLGQIKQN
jgi:hypothetical protein